MKHIHLALAIGVALIASSAALADRGNRFDTDGDGALSFEELSEAKPGLTLERFNEIDRNGDGLITRDERPRRHKRHERPEDTNGDGAIDLTEMQAARPGMTAEKFARIDVNNDGLITPDERPGRRSRAERFAQMDTDGSGGVSREEMQRFSDEKVERMFNMMDENGDGEITVDERKGARNR